MGRRGKRKKPGVAELRKKFFENLNLIKKVLKIRRKLYNGRIIYAIDQSMARTGMTRYYIIDRSFESMSYKNTKGNTYSKIYNLGLWIKNYIDGPSDAPLIAVFEGYAYSSTQWRELLGEVGYAVKSQFFDISVSHRELSDEFVPCLIIPPTSLKKFVAGRGNGVDKKEIHKIVTEEWGADTKNHDESDSYVLAVIAKNIYEIARKYKHPKNFEDLDDKHITKLYKDFFLFNSEIEKSRMEIISNIIILDGDKIDRLRIDKDPTVCILE